MKLVYQYMAIFFNFQTTPNHLHPLQVENCDSNSRLVLDEDDNRKFRLQRVNREPKDASQRTRYVETMLDLCWARFADGGPTLFVGVTRHSLA